MASGAVKHDYHLVNPSPWPLVGSASAFTLAVGLVIFMKGFVLDDSHWSYFLLGEGRPVVLSLGVLGLLYTMIGWWGDIVKESRIGDHTPVVEIGLRYGMILFIASEVMFFVAWFWMFFEMALFHEVRMQEGWIAQFGLFDDNAAVSSGWGSWPPPGVETFDPLHLPLLNTLILLTSGTTVTWAHHAFEHKKLGEAKVGLALTIALGMFFTAVQAVEYSHAHFSFGGNLYGASFFMATGFHGFHVIVGTIFLAVCLLLMMGGELKPERPFAFDAAAWYWHFVDVVWLFLFAFIYVAYQ